MGLFSNTIGSGFNMMDSFLHPEKGYQKGQRALDAAFAEGKGYEIPFQKYGLDQYGRLIDAEGKLLDPGALESEWAKNYETSPYAKQMLEQNRTNGLDAASSMGLMGSSAAINNIQTGAGNIVNQDRQNYMNDLMQKYMAGIGIGQDIYGTGAAMAGKLGDQSLQFGRDDAGLAFGKQNAPGQTFGQIIGMLAPFLSKGAAMNGAPATSAGGAAAYSG